MYKKIKIQAIGTAVPANKISQSNHYTILESANGMNREEKLKLRLIYSRSGIENRHSVLKEFGMQDDEENILFHPANHHDAAPISIRMQLFEKYAAGLGEQAVINCIQQLKNFDTGKITHLIIFSCTGMSAPGLDIQLIEKLKLGRNVERTCINFMGCYAGINAMKVAYHIARSEPDAVILITGVELCTLHYQKSETEDQVVANAIFADGAAAAIISSKDFEIANKKRKLIIKDFYAEFDPAGNDEMVWRIGDYGFDLRLSSYVPALIKNKIHQLMEKLFERAGIHQSDIDFYALHPGGVKILEACEQALHISKQQNEISYKVLRNFGNMSSVTVLFVLKEYLHKFDEKDVNKKILACAFGPGLTMESMLAEIA